MINITELNKSYGSQVLFQDVSLRIGDHERIGLIGRNGSGKSTFLNMLLDRADDQNGALQIPETLRISSLEQHLDFDHDTLLGQVCSALPEEYLHDDWRAKSLLMGLGFVEGDFQKAPSSFSSGFQIRIRLAEALIAEPHLLLLDEPTNYLDILSLRWLSRFLKNWKGSFILVTHDRHFMDEVVTHTVGIHREKMRKMKGGPQKLIDQIHLEEDVYERTRIGQEKKQKKTEEFIRSFRAGARSAGLVQSRIKSLEKQQVHQKLSQIQEIKFHFHSEPFQGDTLLKTHNLNFGYGEELLIKNFSLLANPGDRIAVIGRNGKGKSTLLKLLSGRLKARSGKLKTHPNLQQGYYGSESKDELIPSRSILEELRTLPRVKEQELRNLCGSLLFSGDAAKKQISKLSGGEKCRVCLGKVILFDSHLLFLDEPTNHLDMESCEAFMKALNEFTGTVIFVSHDEDMLSLIANRLVVFDRGEITIREQTYQEFLASGGWSEEEDEGVFKFAKRESDNKKQYLQRKADQKRLRTLQKRQEELEKQLEKLDQQKADYSEQLQLACEKKDYEQMKTLGMKVKDISEQIEGSLEELEAVMDEEMRVESSLMK